MLWAWYRSCYWAFLAVATALSESDDRTELCATALTQRDPSSAGSDSCEAHETRLVALAREMRKYKSRAIEAVS